MQSARRKLNLPFRVSTDTHLAAGTVMAVIGDIPKLGNWNPQKCVPLDRLSKTVDGETWGKEILVSPSERHIKFRYLIAEIMEFNDEDDSKFVKVVQWETFLKPRCLDIADVLLKDDIQVDVFGTSEGITSLERGWLTGQREVHLRIYGEAFKWYKPRHRDRRLFLRCTQVSLKHDQAGEGMAVDYAELNSATVPEEDPETTDSFLQPHLRYNTTYSVLRPGLMGARSPDPSRNLGAVEIVTGDFVTFHFQTLDLEGMSVEFEVFVGARLTDPNEMIEPRLVGTIRMMPFEQTSGIKWLHIFGNHRRVIGQMRIDFLIINPLHEMVQLMDVSYTKLWSHRTMLKVGHRGSGSSYPDEGHPDSKVSAVKENTLRSLRTAFEHGADYVEFDVHLSKDKVPVIYHDFRVVLTLKKKRQEHRYMEVAVKDLTLEELQGLKVSHKGVLGAGHSNDVMTSDESDALETLAFCSLRQIFEHLEDDSTHGFNIEVKHPMKLGNGENEQDNYFERNESVDIILKEVFRSAGKRRIIFSSFDPDVCTMLRLKQNKYPVLFLTQGKTDKYLPYMDQRTHTTMQSLYHAIDMDLLGVAAYSEEVLDNMAVIPLAKENKMVVFVWGADFENDKVYQHLKQLNVDAVIFDRIHEYHHHGTLNVFRSSVNGISPLIGMGEVTEESDILSGQSDHYSVYSSTASASVGHACHSSNNSNNSDFEVVEPVLKRLREEV